MIYKLEIEPLFMWGWDRKIHYLCGDGIEKSLPLRPQHHHLLSVCKLFDAKP